jgi:hypothetical protein
MSLIVLLCKCHIRWLSRHHFIGYTESICAIPRINVKSVYFYLHSDSRLVRQRFDALIR